MEEKYDLNRNTEGFSEVGEETGDLESEDAEEAEESNPEEDVLL